MKYTKTITINGDEYVADDHNFATRKVITHYGSSGRTKPTYEDGAREPDRLVETDTGKVFIFDEEIRNWVEV
jgi:hypothetical protein